MEDFEKVYKILTTLWNVLLSRTRAPYFLKCLTNEGKLKRAGGFQKKFHKVWHLFKNFLRLKKSFRTGGDFTKFRNLQDFSMEFGRN
jgi:hypothetical protein